MKKLLLTILIILLCVLAYFIMFNNFDIGILKIESISNIKNKSDELSKKISKATELTHQTYLKETSSLDTSISKLKSTKQQYESKIASIPESERLNYMQVDNYEKEFLWATIGSYATKENLDLGIDIIDIKNNDYYNLEFTVVGDYSSISNFIFAIEDDDELAFKIENFKMQPYSVLEKTTITKYTDGDLTSDEEISPDYPYNTVYETAYEGETEEENKGLNIVSGTKNNTETQKKQTQTSTSVVNNPDKVKASFIVKQVNVNIK